MGLALFGLLHLVFNASSADVAFFAGFALFAPLGAWHQDRRKLAMDVPGFRQFYDGTPLLPFSRWFVHQVRRVMLRVSSGFESLCVPAVLGR
jgi:uncharacterized membrane protein